MTRNLLGTAVLFYFLFLSTLAGYICMCGGCFTVIFMAASFIGTSIFMFYGCVCLFF